VHTVTINTHVLIHKVKKTFNSRHTHSAVTN